MEAVEEEEESMDPRRPRMEYWGGRGECQWGGGGGSNVILIGLTYLRQ